MQHTDAIIISEGTLRPCDLLLALADALDDRREALSLESLDGAEHMSRVETVGRLDDILAEFEAWQASTLDADPDAGGAHAEDVSDWIDRFETLLADHAPDGYQYGTHPGDGACFGYWPIDAGDLDADADADDEDGSEWDMDDDDLDADNSY